MLPAYYILTIEMQLKRFNVIYGKVSSTDKRWLTDAQIVSLSDIGLIAKATEDELYVFANSIVNATPLAE